MLRDGAFNLLLANCKEDSLSLFSVTGGNLFGERNSGCIGFLPKRVEFACDGGGLEWPGLQKRTLGAIIAEESKNRVLETNSKGSLSRRWFE